MLIRSILNYFEEGIADTVLLFIILIVADILWLRGMFIFDRKVTKRFKDLLENDIPKEEWK